MLSRASSKKYILLIALCFCMLSTYGQRTKGIIKDLEDADFENAIEDLTKSYEKDSLHPGISYLFATLFATDSFPGRNLDSANYFILQAKSLFEIHLEDYDKELEKMELLEADFNKLKHEVDSLAYEDAVDLNEILAYQHYLQRYADSKFAKSAQTNLERLGFEMAETSNSWQAYQNFLNQYPNAVQASTAKKRFDSLVFVDKTSNAGLPDLEDFLIEFPTTPYRKEVETRIFGYVTEDLEVVNIYDFINSYHNPKLTKKGMNILYHINGLSADHLKSFNLPEYENFQDSIGRVNIQNLIPYVAFLDEGKFYFSDTNGHKVIKEGFSNVSSEYLCKATNDQILMVSRAGESEVIDRFGNVLSSGFEEIEDVGDGVIITEEQGLKGAMHVTGFELLPNEYETLEWLGSRFFVASKGEKYQLLNFGGRAVTDTLFDDIFMEGKYWLFEIESQIAISNNAEISQRVGLFKPDFNRAYEEVELFEDKYLIAFDDVQEVMYNEDLEILTPPQTERINTRYNTWVFQMAEGYWTFDKQNGSSSAVTYDDVQQNDEWLALKRNGKWEVYGKNLQEQPILSIDSVKLLGQDIAIVFRVSQGMAIFPNRELVYINEGEDLQSLRQSPGASAHFLVRKSRGKNILYRDGIKLFETSYDEIGFISENAFSVKQYGKYGAVDERGRLVMRVRYDAIGRAENGVASVLYRGKFGGFNFEDKVLLRLDFDHKLVAYSDSLFVVREDGDYGLITKYNEMAVQTSFEEIAYWSDSLFLGKRNDRWSLIEIATGQEYLSDMQTYSFLKNTKDEKILWYQNPEGSGVYHSELGELIPPVFNDVYNLGNSDNPLYFAERGFPEADYNIVVYYNKHGDKIKTAAYRGEAFSKLLCEDLK